MRLYEILKWLEQIPIIEMAKSQQSAVDDITSWTPQIIKHLIKLKVFDSPRNQNKWTKEVNTWLRDIRDITLKRRRTKFSEEEIHDIMWNKCGPTFDAAFVERTVRDVLRDYPNTAVIRQDWETVNTEIQQKLKRISPDLVNGKFASITDY